MKKRRSLRADGALVLGMILTLAVTLLRAGQVSEIPGQLGAWQRLTLADHSPVTSSIHCPVALSSYRLPCRSSSFATANR